MHRKSMALGLLLALGCSGSQSHPLASDPSPFTAPAELRSKANQLSAPRPRLALRHMAARAGLLVGVALARDRLNDPVYADTAAREFNYVTAENAMKWSSLEPQRGVWNLEPADAIVAFAEEHEMALKGHTLIYPGYQLPQWVCDLPEEEFEDEVAHYIATVVGRWAGRIRAWDVGNELIDEDQPDGVRVDGGTPTCPRNVFLDNLGPDYIAWSFEQAHAADPNALLFYNDFGAEEPNLKADFVYSLVADLRARGIPIHGVGFQTHFAASGVGPTAGPCMEANLRRFSDLGLLVTISEMDVTLTPPVESSELERQKAIYSEAARICTRVERCEALSVWGLGDRDSWLGARKQPLLFDQQYAPKPAYFGVYDALRVAHEQP